MFFQIEFGDTLPIYDQVVRQIKFAVAGGVLKEGELIPSVRELARELTINPNTVARAYHRLTGRGRFDVGSRHGLGRRRRGSHRCREDRVELIRTRLEQVFAEAKQSRIDPHKLRELVEQQLAKQMPVTQHFQTDHRCKASTSGSRWQNVEPGEIIMPPVIRLDKLTKRFGAEMALDAVSLEVPPGVVFALLGENGAGKTTAIRIMLGLAQPNSGQAEVLGLRQSQTRARHPAARRLRGRAADACTSG